MHGDPPADLDADRRQLGAAGVPHAGVLGAPLGRHAVRGGRPDGHLLERAEVPVQVGAVVRVEREHRVQHDLPGAVVRDVAAALHAHHRRRAGQDVLVRRPRSERVHGAVLDHHRRVHARPPRAPRRHALVEQPPLQRPHLVVARARVRAAPREVVHPHARPRRGRRPVQALEDASALGRAEREPAAQRRAQRHDEGGEGQPQAAFRERAARSHGVVAGQRLGRRPEAARRARGGLGLRLRAFTVAPDVRRLLCALVLYGVL